MTKDFEQWDTKQSGLSQDPIIGNMKRKTTFSPVQKPEFEMKLKRKLTKISPGKLQNLESLQKKKIIPKQKISNRGQITLQKSSSLSVLKEEPERETPEEGKL